MTSAAIFIFCVATFAIFPEIIHGSHLPPPNRPASASLTAPATSDYALLVIQWPLGLSKVRDCKKQPTVAEFTLHGIWPQVSTAKNRLRTTQPVDPLALYHTMESLKNVLLVFWPSFLSQNDEDFWIHEWEVHGTLSGLSHDVYFGLGLALAEKHCLELEEDLKNSGISPSATLTHAMEEYERGMTTAYEKGSVYEIKCEIDKNSGDVYLVEVRLCVDSNMENLITCPKISNDKFPGCSDEVLFYASV